MVGLSYITQPDDDGIQHHAMIVELLDQHEHELATDPDYMKFRCSVNDGEYEEIVSYNQIYRRIEQEEEK